MIWHVCEGGWQLPKAEKLELAEVRKNFAAVGCWQLGDNILG